MFRSLTASALACAFITISITAPTYAGAQSPAVEAAREAAAKNDRSGSRSILEEACAADDAAACRSLLGLLDKSFKDEDESAARKLASDICDTGDPLGCMALSRFAGHGEGGDVDPALQHEASLKACRAGFASACFVAGQMLRDGEGIARDLDRAAELLELACSGRNAGGCQLLADIHAERAWQEVDADIAAPFWNAARDAYRQSCEYGDSFSCTRLAAMMIDGRGADIDREGALALLEKTCRRDQSRCEEWLTRLAP